MNLGFYVRRLVGIGAAALLIVGSSTSRSSAADVAAPPSLVGTPRVYSTLETPPLQAQAPLPVSVHASPAFAVPIGGCSSCTKKHPWSHRPCNPRAMNINPDACFGFYQTQWQRWEDVCPIAAPAIVVPAPIPSKPADEPKAKSSDAPAPRSSSPPLPSIPKP